MMATIELKSKQIISGADTALHMYWVYHFDNPVTVWDSLTQNYASIETAYIRGGPQYLPFEAAQLEGNFLGALLGNIYVVGGAYVTSTPDWDESLFDSEVHYSDGL